MRYHCRIVTAANVQRRAGPALTGGAPGDWLIRISGYYLLVFFDIIRRGHAVTLVGVFQYIYNLQLQQRLAYWG